MAITRRAFQHLDGLGLIPEMLYLIDLMHNPVILKCSHKRDSLLHDCASGNRDRSTEPRYLATKMTMLKMDFEPQQAPRSMLSCQEQD